VRRWNRRTFVFITIIDRPRLTMGESCPDFESLLCVISDASQRLRLVSGEILLTAESPSR
jgi:hypothetical protein